MKDFPLKYEWDRKNIFITRSQWYYDITGFTFAGAIHCYSGVKGKIALLFTQERVFTFIEGDNLDEPIGESAFMTKWKDAIKRHDIDFPEDAGYAENYFEVFNGYEWQNEVLKYLGIERYKDDIENRYWDIQQMYETVEIPIGITIDNTH